MGSSGWTRRKAAKASKTAIRRARSSVAAMIGIPHRFVHRPHCPPDDRFGGAESAARCVARLRLRLLPARSGSFAVRPVRPDPGRRAREEYDAVGVDSAGGVTLERGDHLVCEQFRVFHEPFGRQSCGHHHHEVLERHAFLHFPELVHCAVGRDDL